MDDWEPDDDSLMFDRWSAVKKKAIKKHGVEIGKTGLRDALVDFEREEDRYNIQGGNSEHQARIILNRLQVVKEKLEGMQPVYKRQKFPPIRSGRRIGKIKIRTLQTT